MPISGVNDAPAGGDNAGSSRHELVVGGRRALLLVTVLEHHRVRAGPVEVEELRPEPALRVEEDHHRRARRDRHALEVRGLRHVELVRERLREPVVREEEALAVG
jgi:hypothetical protein